MAFEALPSWIIQIFDNGFTYVLSFIFILASYENENDIKKKTGKSSQILVILNNTFKPTLVHKVLETKVHNALAFHILLYGSEIWTLIKGLKMIDINRGEILQNNSRVHPFWLQKEWRKFGKFNEKLRWYK
jgi:hypothetical protein